MTSYLISERLHNYVELLLNSFQTAPYEGWILIRFMWILAVFQLFLYLRQQYVFYNKRETIPEKYESVPYWTPEAFEKARKYCMHRSTYGIVSHILKSFILTAGFSSGGLYTLWLQSDSLASQFDYWPDSWEKDVRHLVSFSIFLILAYHLAGISFTIYFTFVMEQVYGFNRQSAWLFFKDRIKVILLAICCGCPLLGVCLANLNHVNFGTVDTQSQTNWLRSLFISIIVAELVIVITVQVILPLFLVSLRLSRGTLRDRVDNLADRVRFPPDQIRIVDMSKRTAHINTEFIGFLINKHIILYDTLLPRQALLLSSREDVSVGSTSTENSNDVPVMTEEEIEAIVAHALGHWMMSHPVKLKLIEAVYNSVFQFWLLPYLLIGYVSTMEYDILIRTVPTIGFFVGSGNWFKNYVSRWFEYDADRFAAHDLQLASQLHSALLKFSRRDLHFPFWDPFYAAWYFGHPSFLDRLDAIEKLIEKDR